MAMAGGTHFYKAADSIGVTQSALTQSISKLEKELGLQLFVRSKSGSVLTEHGQKLYDHAKVITGQLEAAKTELMAQARQLGPEIRVGIIQSLSDQILIRTVTAFKHAYPDYNVTIIKDWSANLATLLIEGEIDFAFLSDHFLPRDMPEMKREPLFLDRVQVVVGEKHELYRHDKLSLADLANHQWVAVSTRPDWPEFLVRVFASADIRSPPHILRTNSMTLAAALIKEGHAIGMLSPKLFPSSDHEAGRVKYFAVPEIEQERRFSMCRRARMVVRPFHQYFIDNLRTAILEWMETERAD
jgi:DNA-binding transcriptional LysR family regulator